MKISASISSKFNRHKIEVSTNDISRPISILPKANGYGSEVNGGELLLLSLATCFCNDLYREAQKRNLTINGIEIVCTCEFGAEGEAGSNFNYNVHVTSAASAEEINELIHHTDRVAEIHNTLRKGINITLQNEC